VALRKRLLAAALLALGVSLAPTARAVIVERVVAIVGERPILLSDLLHRARPFRGRIRAASASEAQVAAQESEMFKQLLTRLIDDRLEEHAADRAHVSVSAEEIDNAIRNVAKGNNIQPAQLVSEAKRQGLTEQDYRDELRRQILEGKLIQLRVRSRVRITEQDGRAMYERWLKEPDSGSQTEVRILAKRVPPGADAAVVKALELLMENVVTRAREGEDYCAMVALYSDDQSTKTTCGSRGPLPLAGLLPAVQAAIQTLKPGELTDPISVGGAFDQAILVVQLVTPPRVPKFEDVKDAMMERALTDAMEQQRKNWLEELRRSTYVESRL